MTKKTGEIFMYILGALLIVGFFILLIFLVLKPVPIQNNDLLSLVVGALLGSFTSVVSYFFGSSAGSKQKTDLLHTKKDS